MVDALVSFATERLGNFLLQKAECRLSFGDEAEWLKSELEYMQSFLKFAERNQGDPRVQRFALDVKDLACETLDTLDEFKREVDGSGEALQNGIIDRLKSFAWIGNKEANLCKIGNKIKSLRERVSDLYRKRKSYGIPNISEAGEGSSNNNCSDNGSSVRQLRKSTPFADEEEIVGFKDVTEMLSKELLKDEPRCSFISMWGMGGTGKTTLARKVYHSQDVQKEFDCSAWLCVSPDYSISNLLRTIIKSFKKGSIKLEELEMLEKMNEVDLEGYLHEFLEKKRYLVVVDDLWQKETWQSLKKAFPNCQNGSRVIVTTRNKEVAERVDGRGFVHHLRFMTAEESWDLFRKKISRGEEHIHWFSPRIQEIGKEIVQRCTGLPLAISVLGGLLSTKREPEYWYKVKEQLWQHMEKDSIEISPLLSLSYNDLSHELKQCFLYTSIFPENHEISSTKLTHMWIAEGLVQGNNLEDNAERSLHELIDRCLIQVAERSWRGIETCGMHGLIRDLAVKKAMEMDLFDLYDSCTHKSKPSSNQSRLAIHSNVKEAISNGHIPASLKSLVVFNSNSEKLSTETLETVCETFKDLHVLELEGCSLDGPCMLPDDIGALSRLKYLSLRGNNFCELPSTIGKLNMLQYLDLQLDAGLPCRLSMQISKLVNLRHLNLYNCEGNFPLDALINLRTLKGIKYCHWMNTSTVNLVNLEELSLHDIKPLEGKPYSLDSISNLPSLTTLSLQSSETLPPLEPLFSCSLLFRLLLQGKIEKLPSVDQLPQSLTSLALEGSQLLEDPMPALEKLSNLSSLYLDDNAYNGKEIVCSNNGFHQLEYLRLILLENLENWRLAETSMPVIRSLTVVDCPKLEMIPERLKSMLTCRL